MNRHTSINSGRMLAGTLLIAAGCASTRASTPSPPLGPVPHVEPSVAQVALAPPRADPCPAVPDANAASASVERLTRSNGSELVPVGRSLDALARAIRALGTDDDAIAAAALRVSQDALLLERADELDAGAPAWTKDGLFNSISATEGLAGSHGIDDIDAWTGNARAATLAIDSRTELVFQQAIVQDAFRSTADALLLVAHSDARCQAPLPTNPTQTSGERPPGN